MRLSAILEKILSPIVCKVKTYVKDDWHFLRLLPHHLNFKETTLYSVDITSLYTSISHDLGFEAILYWITKHRDAIPSRFTDTFIMESVQIILHNNNFIFNNNYYNQTEGTAMGTKAAPPYACLVIAYLEETKLFPTLLPIYFTPEQCKWIENHYKRYMDDGFIPLLKSIDIQLFLKCLNSMHNNINLTVEKATITVIRGHIAQNLSFLDVNVILTEQNLVETDIFYKSTNSHDYLNFHSSHPEHVNRNIPYNLAKRIICFVTNPTKMKERLDELRVFLRNSHYPYELIERGIFNAQLQGPAPQKQKSTLPLVTTNFSNMKFNHIVSKANFLLKSSTNERIKEIFSDQKVILSQRQPPNLLRLLSNAKFEEKTQSQLTKQALILKCTDKRCKICLMYLQQDESFLLSNKNTWIVKRQMSCHSKNVIYYLTCNRCDGLTTYIGKTNNLRLRMNQHMSTCRTGNGSDKFDQHVHHCEEKNKELKEPFFKLYLLMELNDEKNLLTYESHFHKLGFDTMN